MKRCTEDTGAHALVAYPIAVLRHADEPVTDSDEEAEEATAPTKALSAKKARRQRKEATAQELASTFPCLSGPHHLSSHMPLAPSISQKVLREGAHLSPSYTFCLCRLPTCTAVSFVNMNRAVPAGRSAQEREAQKAAAKAKSLKDKQDLQADRDRKAEKKKARQKAAEKGERRR